MGRFGKSVQVGTGSLASGARFLDQDCMVHEISVFEELDDAVHDPVYFHQDNGVKVLQHRAQAVI
jgi:hypothetical protein